jgi:butyryl-CoA dehydrogenase
MSWSDAYSFLLSEEEILARDTARAFSNKKIVPLAEKIDKEQYFPSELIPELGSLGLMGVFTPVEWNGSGLSYTAYALVIEELARACASTSIIVSAHNSLCLWPIIEYGTQEQKAVYLPKLASGKAIGCFALSEPGTGSDASNLTCTVKKSGNEYIINGTKNWITNGPVADFCVLFCMQDAAKGSRGITAFVHSMKEKGIRLGRKEDKLGICGSPTCSIMYDNVLLGKEHIISGEEKGFTIAMNTLNGGRIGVAAQALGIAVASLNDALLYAKERKTFGKPIFEHQTIQIYLAEMAMKIDAARYLILGAARRKDEGKPYIRQAAEAKLFASQTAMECADKCIQIHGGYGYVKDFPAERHLRDAKITEIYEGTSEIQRLIIAGSLLKEEVK